MQTIVILDTFDKEPETIWLDPRRQYKKKDNNNPGPSEIQRHKQQKEVIKRREGLNIDLPPTLRRIQKESSSTSITSPTSITSSQSTPQENPIVLPGTPQVSSSTLQLPPINMVTMFSEHLWILVAQIAQDNARVIESITTHQAEEEQNIAPTNWTPRENSKDLKFAEQGSFGGKPEDLDPMLREAEICFSVQNDIYTTETRKAYWLTSSPFSNPETQNSGKNNTSDNAKAKLSVKGTIGNNSRPLWKKFSET